MPCQLRKICCGIRVNCAIRLQMLKSVKIYEIFTIKIDMALSLDFANYKCKCTNRRNTEYFLFDCNGKVCLFPSPFKEVLAAEMTLKLTF